MESHAIATLYKSHDMPLPYWVGLVGPLPIILLISSRSQPWKATSEKSQNFPTSSTNESRKSRYAQSQQARQIRL